MTYLNISLFVLIVIRQCANVQYATTESGLVWLVLRLKDYFLSQFLDHIRALYSLPTLQHPRENLTVS